MSPASTVRRLGVVDQSPIASGASPAQALANSVDLAQACEQLGYSRYWVAEHHSSEGLAGSSPEILISKIAEATNTMRVGSGGVMLTHYSSLKVAEQFKMLAAFHPGRIDLGLGRAPGSDQLTAAALTKGPGATGAQHYPEQVQDLQAYLRGTDGTYVDASPNIDEHVPVWLLASSEGSAAIAAHFGLPLSFAHFITMADGPAIAAAYRRQYQPSEQFPEPIVNVALSAICADTDAEAQRLALSLKAWRTRGLSGRIPSPEETEDYPERRRPLEVSNGRKPLIAGDPEACKAEISELAKAYDTDEVLIITITHDHGTRVRSYELLSEAFALPRPVG